MRRGKPSTGLLASPPGPELATCFRPNGRPTSALGPESGAARAQQREPSTGSRAPSFAGQLNWTAGQGVLITPGPARGARPSNGLARPGWRCVPERSAAGARLISDHNSRVKLVNHSASFPRCSEVITLMKQHGPSLLGGGLSLRSSHRSAKAGEVELLSGCASVDFEGCAGSAGARVGRRGRGPPVARPNRRSSPTN